MNAENSHIVAVDLDGTLASYQGWQGIEHIGDPVPVMASRVKAWIHQGKTVALLTARAGTPEAIPFIRAWLDRHGFERIEIITDRKDYRMVEFWDDRAFGVIQNTGITRETPVAQEFRRVLETLGIRVEDGLSYEEAARHAVKAVKKLGDRESIIALLDGASSALAHGKPEDVARAKRLIDRVIKHLT